jgi:hypothetical protein
MLDKKSAAQSGALAPFFPFFNVWATATSLQAGIRLPIIINTHSVLPFKYDLN